MIHNLDKKANEIHFDKNISGMNTDNVQAAIDELKGTVGYSKKNLLKYPYTNTNATLNGVTWVDNGQGLLSATGTATTENSWFYCRQKDTSPLTLKKGTYILSGCPAGGGNAKYQIYIVESATSNKIAIDNGNGCTFTLTEQTNVGVTCIIYPLQQVSNLVFKPMIRPASIEDGTYEPYVPSVNGEFGYWTPNAKEAPTERNYYIKTKNMLYVFFTVIPNTPISNSAQSYNACLDVKKTFGVKSFKDAFAYVYASNFAPIHVFASSGGNVLAFQYSGKEVSTNYAIYGQITLCIDQ
jgi:hypothetical protein